MFDRSDFLNNAVNVARMIISHKVSAGDVVVDATMGNGNDTLFLAELVGAHGKVYGFDIQQLAVDNTIELLKEHKCLKQVKIIHAGHEQMDEYIDQKVKLVLFNLGYLPGADKEITTRPDTSLPAIEKALSLLDDHGLVLLVIYHGHEDGRLEKIIIEDFAKKLFQKEYNVFSYDLINQANNPPILIGIEKR